MRLLREALGIFSIPGAPTDEGGCLGAMRYFEQGGDVPLMAKAERKSTVHRRVPLDLVVVPIHKSGKIIGIGVHAGLWTSEALRVPPEDVPVLRAPPEAARRRLRLRSQGALAARRCAMQWHPCRATFCSPSITIRSGTMVMMAMSLADRPRPALLQVRSILNAQLFSFVWLPREELTTGRRTAIAMLLENEVGQRDHELVGRAW